MIPFLYFVAVVHTARQALHFDLRDVEDKICNYRLWAANMRAHAVLHGWRAMS